MAGQVGVAPSTTTVQVGGFTFAFGNWEDDKLYGVGEFITGQTDEEMLLVAGRSEPIPGGTRKMNRHDTNIPKGGLNGLPKDWEAYVFAFGVSIDRVMRGKTATPAVGVFPDGGGAFSDDARHRVWFDFNRKVFLDFQYNDTVWTQGVPQNYPPGHGWTGFSTASNFEVIQNGKPSPADRVSLILPVWMREGLGYFALFKPEAALTIDQPASDDTEPNLGLLDLRFEMFGLYKKVVVGA